MSRLDPAKAKVQWAEKHFGDFKDIILGRSSGTDTRKTTVIHYQFQGQPSPAPANFLAPSRECRLAFGDAIHQLRSALDHIVYVMVQPLTTDPKILRKVDFPIYVDDALFKGTKSFKHLGTLLRLDQFAAIVRTQLYERNVTAPQTDPLWILSELDNINKHRTILVVDPRLMTVRKGADGQVRVVKQPLVPGAIGFRPQLPAPDEVDVQDPAFTVVLSETGLAYDNRIVFGVWRELIDNVKAVIT